MYIRKIEIKNIRSIEHFEMTFPEGQEAGWHVLIGDNGAGKSTIVKSAALALLSPDDISATREDWEDWLRKGQVKGSIDLRLALDKKHDLNDNIENFDINNQIFFARQVTRLPIQEVDEPNEIKSNELPRIKITDVSFVSDAEIVKMKTYGTSIEGSKYIDFDLVKLKGWFSVAYGPYRRFTGGNIEKEKLFSSRPRLGAHLSIFGEDVALSEALNYLRELYILKLENKVEVYTLDELITFINNSNLLPHNTIIDGIDSSNVYFRDGNGNRISAIQMSDGYRSILSLTFELIRQLIKIYGSGSVFGKVRQGIMIIDLPGVVLVDEMDAHLHPTWQTRIGQWFLKYFPNLQFIVTTHSPLVCRASEKGSIWRLAAPGSNQKSGKVTGIDRDRLIFGNVLDAYGTEVFGQDVERSDKSQKKLERLAHLSQLNAYGKLSESEKEEMNQLRKILITDDTTEF